MHIFHLLYDKCTITLKDVHLQLWLTVDGARIEIAWLRNNFVELVEDSIEEERERYAQVWNHAPSHVGLSTELEDIRLLLDQRLEVDFERTPYDDQAIRVIILKEFFVNPNAWHVKELDNLHHIKLRLPDTNWSIFHLQYINMWDNRYDFLPTRENIIILELTCDPDYMSWFKIHDKSYLYWKKARHRHPHTSRPRRGPLNLMGDEAGPSSTPTQELTPTTSAPMPTPPPVHPSMHEAPTESPLVGHLPNHLFIDLRMHNDNRKWKDLHRPKANPDNHNFA
ncbi:hypothetical protein CXB51_010959 [Gossypium anomalum]|uniref:Uncharacterized protein n=1 Tax=Gossypium anomalum TaxID=47600 RepID=A0A8J6D2P1_9ROSI|nr:hypothetical protein CXB51_010959 [Gossypium anomalum]